MVVVGVLALLLVAAFLITRPGSRSAGRPQTGATSGSSRQTDPAPSGPWGVPEKPPASSIRGHCHVVDGDTICIAGKSIRLAGIDAPELDHPYGRNAKWALVELCRNQPVRAEFIGEFSYGRYVATCFLPDGRDLSAEMVRLGHAVDWRKFSGGRYRHLETPDARKRLWRCDARQKGRFPPPKSAWER
jgi:endonuclease YncB( thermonuclease family)